MASLFLHKIHAARRLLPVCMFLVGIPTSAQESKPGQRPLVDYIYATQLGTGIYQVAGRTVQVYRIPINFRLRSIEEHGWGLKLRFPLTFGFYDFEVPDVLEGEFPDRLSTLTLMAGVEVSRKIKPNWILTPFLEFGGGKDLDEGGEWTLIWSIGLESRSRFPWKSFVFAMGNEIRWAGSVQVDGQFDDGFVRLKNGVDVQLPWRFSFVKRESFVTTYYYNLFYYDDLEFQRFEPLPLLLNAENEIGVSMGTDEDWKWWLLKVDRFGIGYRFGGGLSVVRLFIGFPF